MRFQLSIRSLIFAAMVAAAQFGVLVGLRGHDLFPMVILAIGCLTFSMLMALIVFDRSSQRAFGVGALPIFAFFVFDGGSGFHGYPDYFHYAFKMAVIALSGIVTQAIYCHLIPVERRATNSTQVSNLVRGICLGVLISSAIMIVLFLFEPNLEPVEEPIWRTHGGII